MQQKWKPYNGNVLTLINLSLLFGWIPRVEDEEQKEMNKLNFRRQLYGFGLGCQSMDGKWKLSKGQKGLSKFVDWIKNIIQYITWWNLCFSLAFLLLLYSFLLTHFHFFPFHSVQHAIDTQKLVSLFFASFLLEFFLHHLVSFYYSIQIISISDICLSLFACYYNYSFISILFHSQYLKLFSHFYFSVIFFFFC